MDDRRAGEADRVSPSESDGSASVAPIAASAAAARTASAPAGAAPAGAALADAAPAPADPPGLSWLLLLAGVTAIGPFAMQAIAPALPGLSASLDVSVGAAQSMISLAMLATALGAVVYGPFADHYGRRPVLLAGLVLSTLGAAVATLAPLFELALAGRVAQALGAGAGMVLARAAAQDLFQEKAATALAKITAAMVVAPMIAPAVGGVLTDRFGWRAIFALVTVASLGLWLLAWRRFGETARTLSPRLALGDAVRDYGAILRRTAFQAYAGFGALMLASFFLFVSAAPYVMERAYGVGPSTYGLMFILAAMVYMAGNLASPWATERFGGEAVMAAGAAIGVLSCASAAAATWAFQGAPGFTPEDGLIGAMVLMAGVGAHGIGSGLTTPNAIAGAVAAYPERAGSASSLLSVAQFGAAAVAAQSATLLPFGSGAPLAACMAGLTAAAWGCFWVRGRH